MINKALKRVETLKQLCKKAMLISLVLESRLLWVLFQQWLLTQMLWPFGIYKSWNTGCAEPRADLSKFSIQFCWSTETNVRSALLHYREIIWLGVSFFIIVFLIAFFCFLGCTLNFKCDYIKQGFVTLKWPEQRIKVLFKRYTSISKPH